MIRNIGRIAAISLGFLLVGASAGAEMAQDTLSIRTQQGQLHRFTVEIPQTPEEKSQGLMHRKSLADDRGMLFVNDRDIVMRMWMKDTPLPLDMLFIDSQGTIVYIAKMTTPHSTATIGTPNPVRAVLELPGGSCDKKGIRVGDRVIHHYFKP